MQMLHQFPDWLGHWLALLLPGLHIGLIVGGAWLLNRLIKRLLQQLGEHYNLPLEWLVWLRGMVRWVITGAAVLLVLGRVGVSASVLWTAFTGFAAVAAVAFFAAWSVLSNLFCALLIMAVQPFRVGDDIELLDTAEKPGAKGRVVDINMLYTTLREAGGAGRLLQIPNALIFQRVMRRWPGGEPPQSPAASTVAPGAGFAGPPLAPPPVAGSWSAPHD